MLLGQIVGQKYFLMPLLPHYAPRLGTRLIDQCMEPHFHLVFADSTMCQLIIVKVANVNVLIYLGSNLRLTSTQCIKKTLFYINIMSVIQNLLPLRRTLFLHNVM